MIASGRRVGDVLERLLLGALTLVVVAALGSPSLPARAAPQLERIALRVENDIGFGDEDYTSGLFVSLVGPDRRGLPFEDELLRALSAVSAPFGDELTHAQLTLRFAQQLYTPHFYWFPEVRRRERPFAALGFGALGARLMGPRDELVVDARVGTLGQGAFPYATQTVSHRFLSPWSPTPVGWGNQVGDAPYVGVTASGVHHAIVVEDGPVRFVSLSLATAAEVGTVLAHVEGGPRLSLGYFGRDGPHRAVPGRALLRWLGLEPPGVVASALRGLDVNLTTALVYRAVAMNALVEGTPFSSSVHTAEAVPHVARAEAHLQLMRAPLWLGLSVVARSRETMLSGEEPWHRYWGVELGLAF